MKRAAEADIDIQNDGVMTKWWDDDACPYERQFVPMEIGWDDVLKPKVFNKLEAMLDGGLRAGQTNIFGPKQYVKFYTLCFDMCTQEGEYPADLYQRHGATIQEYLQKTVLPALQETANTATAASDNASLLLHEVDYRWSNHLIMNKWLSKFFYYLERTYIPTHQVPTLQQVGLNSFQEFIYQPFIKQRVTEAILQLVAQERQGHLIEKTVVKRIVTLYEAMGSMGTTSMERYYQADLEAPLLQATREYYTQKSQEWISTDSTPQYLVKAEDALAEEKKRVHEYLNASSEHGLLAVLEQELLIPVQSTLLENPSSGCRALLENDKTTDLQRMFRLFARLEKTNGSSTDGDENERSTTVSSASASPPVVGLKPIAAIVQEYILDCGKDIISSRKAWFQDGGKMSSRMKNTEDSKFVKDLMDLHDKQLAMVKRDFYGHSLFQKALKNAFFRIVNADMEVEEQQQQQQSSNAQLLSTYCDGILHGSSAGQKLTETQVEEHLECLVQLFCYLQEKDMFAEIYRNQLAKRLLSQRSTSDDAEKLMIAKLKVQCGTQFTSKMEGMLSDICLGQEQKQEFEQHVRKQKPSSSSMSLDFSVQVLNRGFWPTYKKVSSDVVTLPSSMSNCMKVFESWHDQKHAKRKLTWVLTQGSATVRATFPAAKTKKTASYNLQVSTLQAIVLDALSGHVTPQPFEDLARTVNIEAAILKPILHSLSCGKHKVVCKTPAGNKISTTDTFVANAKFSSNLRKIRIPMPSLESLLNIKKVQEDRGIAIDARIVRIMKARKTLGHQQLLSEVLSQLSFFNPNPRQVKKRIEALIDKDYLERSKDNNSVYNYLA